MKILIYDYLFVVGHAHPNEHYIRILSKKYEVSVVSVDGFYSRLSDVANVIEIESRYSADQIQDSRLKQVMFCKKVTKQVDTKRYDYVLMLSYDNTSFIFSKMLFPKKARIILQAHNNIDRLSRKPIERILFKTYSNKVMHIVYEDFMKKALSGRFGVKSNRVYVLPRARFAYDIIATDKHYTAIGLSGSNNDRYIEELIGEMNEHQDEFPMLRLLLKMHYQPLSECDSIEIITKRISDREYKECFSSTRIVLDPLPEAFEYRMSAVLFEALSSRKIVVGSASAIIQHFASKYPHICFCAENSYHMLQIVSNICRHETEEEKIEFDKFNVEYSDDKTMEVFNTIFV